MLSAATFSWPMKHSLLEVSHLAGWKLRRTFAVVVLKDQTEPIRWSSATNSSASSIKSDLVAILDKPQTTEQDLKCLATTRGGDSKQSEPAIDGLLILAVKDSTLYYRVGTFSRLNETNFDGFTRERLTLV